MLNDLLESSALFSIELANTHNINLYIYIQIFLRKIMHANMVVKHYIYIY